MPQGLPCPACMPACHACLHALVLQSLAWVHYAALTSACGLVPTHRQRLHCPGEPTVAQPQRGAAPQAQKGAAAQAQRGATPQAQKGAAAQAQRGRWNTGSKGRCHTFETAPKSIQRPVICMLTYRDLSCMLSIQRPVMYVKHTETCHMYVKHTETCHVC